MKNIDKVVFLIFLMSPLAAFPFIVWEISRERRGATYLMALFMAVFAFLFPPIGDLSHHNMIYFQWDSYSVDDFLMWLSRLGKMDKLIWFLSFIFRKIGINFAFIRFLCLLVEFSVFSWIYERFVLNAEMEHKDKMLIYSLMCISFMPLYQIMGLRHGLGIALYMVGIIFLYIDKRILMSILFFLLAAYSHTHFFPMAVLAMVCNYIILFKSKKTFICCFLIAIVFGLVLTPILLKFSMGDSELVSVYTANGYYGQSFEFEGKAGKAMLIARFWYIPLVIYFLREEGKDLLEQDERIVKFRGFVYAVVLIVAVTWGYLTFSERTGKVLGGLLCLYLCLKSSPIKGILKCIPLLLFITAFYQIYGLRLAMFYLDNNLGDIWKPLPLIFQDEYSKAWLIKNINPNGSFKLQGTHWSL